MWPVTLVLVTLVLVTKQLLVHAPGNDSVNSATRFSYLYGSIALHPFSEPISWLSFRVMVGCPTNMTKCVHVLWEGSVTQFLDLVFVVITMCIEVGLTSSLCGRQAGTVPPWKSICIHDCACVAGT